MKKPNFGLAVDGSTRGNPGPSKYRIFDLEQNKIIFESEWIGVTTNNVCEFMAVCHAIYWNEKNKTSLPIYSDSQTAISWIKNGRVNSGDTNLKDRIKKAETYLKEIKNKPEIQKWHTSMWGESPADFGLKR